MQKLELSEEFKAYYAEHRERLIAEVCQEQAYSETEKRKYVYTQEEFKDGKVGTQVLTENLLEKAKRYKVEKRVKTMTEDEFTCMVCMDFNFLPIAYSCDHIICYNCWIRIQ